MSSEQPGLVPLLESGFELPDPKSLVIDETQRRARLLPMTSEGLLGLGKSRRFIPVDLVTPVDEHVLVARGHRDVYADPTATARETGDDGINADAYDPKLVGARTRTSTPTPASLRAGACTTSRCTSTGDDQAVRLVSPRREPGPLAATGIARILVPHGAD